MLETTPASNEGICQRQYDRVSVERPIKIMSDEQTYQLKMINLSLGGIGVTGAHLFEDNTPVSIEFKLPFYDELTSIKTNATIVHSTPVRGEFLVGIKYNALTHHQQAVLQRYVQYKIHHG